MLGQAIAWAASAWGTVGALAFLLWIVLFIFLGIRTLRKGHWVMFLIGIFLPIFWIIGALIPARR